MTLDKIIAQAERLRRTKVGMSNYDDVLEDAFTVIRELAERVKELDAIIVEMRKKPAE